MSKTSYSRRISPITTRVEEIFFFSYRENSGEVVIVGAGAVNFLENLINLVKNKRFPTT